MTELELFDALDGLYAYDSGATDSGIRDEGLKEKVKTHLEDMEDEAFRITMSMHIRECFVSEEAIKQGYGIEDVKAFIDWLDREMNCSVNALDRLSDTVL